MEEDGLEANLGVAAESTHEFPAAARVPKKRFVGRKTAQNGVEQSAAPTIENSGAIQGK